MNITLPLGAENNLRKLADLMQENSGQLILLAWREKCVLRHSEYQPIIDYSPTVSRYLLGVIGQNPQFPVWPDFSLPLDRFLIDGHQEVILGEINGLQAIVYGIDFLQCNDPELLEIPFEDDITGLVAFVGNSRVKQWVLKQESLHDNGARIIKFWRECKRLNYQIEDEMPEIESTIEARRQAIIANLVIILKDAFDLNRLKIDCFLEEAKDFGLDSREIIASMQLHLSRLLILKK